MNQIGEEGHKEGGLWGKELMTKYKDVWIYYEKIHTLFANLQNLGPINLLSQCTKFPSRCQSVYN